MDKKATTPLRIVLLSMAHNPLFDAVFNSNHNVVGVIAQRQSKQSVTPRFYIFRRFFSAEIELGAWCKERNVPLVPYAEDSDTLNQIRSLNADVLVVSRAMRVSEKVCSIFKYGGLNVHPSKLPEYRGGSPLFWQAVDQVEGLHASVHKMTETFDQGEILAYKSAPRPSCGTEKQILKEITILESSLIVDVLNNLNEFFYRAKPQPEKTPTRYASYVSSKNVDKVIDPKKLSIEQYANILRFVQHWPCQLLVTQGLQRLFLWQPRKIIRLQEADSAEKDSLILKRKGLTFYARHPEGLIQFFPKFSAKRILRRIGLH